MSALTEKCVVNHPIINVLILNSFFSILFSVFYIVLYQSAFYCLNVLLHCILFYSVVFYCINYSL